VKIYDGFMFNNELDLLELRLMELGDLVDHFIVVERAVNFMRQPKPLHFQENKKRFAEWLPKIRHVVVADGPVGEHPAIEHHQRRQIALGFADADPGDVLIIGDVDEIPTRAVVAHARELPPEHPITFVQRLYYYSVNWLMGAEWPGTVICPRASLGLDPDCEKLRQHRFHFPKLCEAGSHFSWLGPVEQIQEKLRCIDVTKDAQMHGTPWMVKPDPDSVPTIEHCMASGRSLFTDRIVGKFVDVRAGATHPAAIEAWLVAHPEYLSVVPA
jgi:beta-1,4-mannosyl-glycoprotein beta-1,4-N-acetylglucosaminyltransferase